MNTITLTIYTERFDSQENIVNGGMSGKAYLDIEDEVGMDFQSVDSALDYCVEHDLPIDIIEFNYLSSNGEQMFKKFPIQ